MCVCFFFFSIFFNDWTLYYCGRYKRQSFARDLFEDLISAKWLPHFVCGSVTLFYRIWVDWCLSTALVSEVWTAAPFWCGEIAGCLMWPILSSLLDSSARPGVCSFNCRPYWDTFAEETVSRTYGEKVHFFKKRNYSHCLQVFGILNDVNEYLVHESRTRG